jgi:hypothetical protein
MRRQALPSVTTLFALQRQTRIPLGYTICRFRPYRRTFMNKLRKHTFIALTAGALLLGMSVPGGHAFADETAGQKIDRIAYKTGYGIRKGAEWAGNGIKKGATKAGEGISKGMTHAAHGIKKAAQKTGEAFAKVGNKLQETAS